MQIEQLRRAALQTTPELVIGFSVMKPVKREFVTLPELRRGDTCVITMERAAHLLVRSWHQTSRKHPPYTPTILRTVSATERVAAARICTYVLSHTGMSLKWFS